ncbi:MAG TPA: hypothetical protein VHL80_13900 [Polyangia bacterium]|nr:hypothetical protein [Polyangia bacterium]
MTRSGVIIGAVAAGAVIGVLSFLRPKPTARDELAAPGTIPPAAVAVLRSKMVHHDAQMKTLLDRVLMLDDDGIARAAGEIFDEPALARPLLGDELNALLPERFFALQGELREHARRVVAASVRHDRAAVADELGALSKSCVACHEAYLFESGVGAAPSHASR